MLLKLLSVLEKNGWKVSTDTRKDVAGSVYFALKGENFDGKQFVEEALNKGAIAAVTEDAQETLQKVTRIYREKFNIPIIAIGGSNGKTTSKELMREVLKTKYRVHATSENLNNHIGVPLSILAMKKDVEIGLFEIGANHPGEHTKLLEILKPTIVIVTNNGLDHLEGFGSPLGVRKANKEIYDWALSHTCLAFVNKNLKDLIEDSKHLEKILYPEPEFDWREYKTNLAGSYNIANIHLALSIGKYFSIDINRAEEAISKYKPLSKRSEFLEKNGINFIVDCYNANPSSMKLSLESFLQSSNSPRGVILGDMLELGLYSDEEHAKIVGYVSQQNLDCTVFIGSDFKKALENHEFRHSWFPNSTEAREWFKGQKFDGFTFLLKGSRGIKVEKILNT